MKQNAVGVWINSDKKLQELITEIESTDKPLSEKAEEGFEKLCVMYNIPRMPENVRRDEDESDDQSKDDGEQRSLFEEHAYIKFLSDGKDDPRGLVLSAAYHLLNDYQIDLSHIAKKGFGKKIPKECLIALKGDGYHGEVVFPEKEGKSWTELGCIQMTLFCNERC
ncbi:MAG: hypothetical protein WBP08_02160 [Saprospiraceae bacterium]